MLTLLSMFGGGLVRLLPEVFSFLNKKTDNAHELAMLEKQFQLEQTRASAKAHEIEQENQANMAIAMLDANKDALLGQMQKTGLSWVDAANFLVRPITTYYFLLLYGFAKAAMFSIAISSGVGGWEAILKIYDPDDRAILSGILAFWFVGRVFDKKV